MSVKDRLREKSMRTIMECSSADRFKPTFVELFSSLAKYKEGLFAALDCLKKPAQVKFSTEIFKLLKNTFCLENFPEKEEQIKVCRLILEIINVQLPQSNSKLDIHAMKLILASSEVSYQLFSGFCEVAKEDKGLLQNIFVQMFLLIIYDLSHSTELLEIISPFINKKLSFGPTGLATLKIYANEKVSEQEKPTIKSFISLFKSACDNGIGELVVHPFMACLAKYGMESTAKDVVSIIPLILKKIKKQNNSMCEFCNFLMDFMSFDEAFPLIKSVSDDIVNGFLLTVNSSADITAELSDPLSYLCTDIAQGFIKVCTKLGIDECTILQQKATNYPIGVMLLSIFICRTIDVKRFENVNKEQMLEDLTDACQAGSPELQLLITLSGYFVVNFNSRRGLEILVTGLKLGSRQACNWILSEEMPFQTVFSELASEFDPEKSGQLYFKTLISVLQVNIQTQPDELPADDSVTAYSDSNFESISGLSRYSSDNDELSNLQGVPTPETTLFCTTISRYIDFPEMATLLPLAASAISPSFASDLTKNMKAQKRKRSKLELIASYSNSLGSLEIETLHSLAQTFLLLSPGMPMLFLAVSLQRLPSNIIKSMMQKTTPFAATSPDFFGRMVALLSHSHPQTAINFLESFIDSTIQRRKSFFFRRSSSEDNEQNTIAVFRSIGYCSTFVDTSYFASEFLPFATRFLNKYLTNQSKTTELLQAELFSVRKLSNRLVQIQDQSSEHIFPFKDFLTQFVCAFYADIGDEILNNSTPNVPMVTLCLQTLTSLLPVRPIRVNDKYEDTIKMTAIILQNSSEEDFNTLSKPAMLFYSVLIKANPSILVISEILTSLITNILSKERWNGLLEIVSNVCSKWEEIRLSQGSAGLSQLISQLGLLLTSILPLLSTDCSKTVLKIVENICSLLCAIRNQILSLPKSIRPVLPEITNEDPDEITKIGCTFTSKHLLTSQIFEIITGLLEFASDGNILPIHQRGCLVCVLFLVKERGTEEFRYDSKIVSLLIKASKKSEESLSVCLDVFRVLGSMRFYSVLSAVFTQKEEVIPILPKVLSVLLTDKKSILSLLNVVSNMPIEEASESSWFTLEALPYLGSAISQISDEIFAKIFVSVAILTRDAESPVFFSLFGGENMKELLTIIEQERPLAFPLILSFLPEDKDNFLSILSLQLAEISEESCSASLAYFFEDQKEVTEEMFTYLSSVLSSNPFSAWSAQSQQIATLTADNIIAHKSALECANVYIKNCDDDSLSSIWSAIVLHAKEDFDAWFGIICDLSYRIDAISFGPIISQLVVRSNDPNVGNVIGKIYDALEKPENKKVDIIEQILTSSLYSNCDFTKEFVEMIKSGEHVSESIAAISIICNKITPDNSYAIEAIIDVVTGIQSDDDDTCAVNVLSDLIF